MKLTNGEVRLMKEPLEKLSTMRLPVKVSFGVAKLSNLVEKNFNEAEQVRVKLVNEYGVAGDDGITQVTLASKENQEKFWNEFIELLNIEVDLDIEPLELPDDLEVEAEVLKPLLSVMK